MRRLEGAMSADWALRQLSHAMLATLLLLGGLSFAYAESASAELRILSFYGLSANQDGTSATQAGGHPYSYSTGFKMGALAAGRPDGQMKDVEVDLPPGLVGNPGATPTKCTPNLLFNTVTAAYECPNSSQVGMVDVYRAAGPDKEILQGSTPLFNMAAPPGKPADFAFSIVGVPIHLTPRLRSGGDYGLTVVSPDISQIIPVTGVEARLWGVPADPSHNVERVCTGVGIFSGEPLFGCTTDAPQKAFMTNPTNCDAGVFTTVMRANSWQAPNVVRTQSFNRDTNNNATAVTDCDRVPFDPRIQAQPTSHQPDSPTGMDIEVSMPTDGLNSPKGIAQAHLKKAVVTLPEGMTVSPSAADGLQACSPMQVSLTTDSDPTCPDASRIGSVEIKTPLLDDPMGGAVYLAQQRDNPFRSLLAMYIVARGPGIVVKLPGRVDIDANTGRLTTTFDNTPQLPFSSLRLRLNGGERAPLATPPTCGKKEVSAEFTPWSGTGAVKLSDSFNIDCPGMSGFSPAFTAGLVEPIGGAFSPFALRLERPDRQEFVDGLNVDLPRGLLAKIRGIPLCSSDNAALGSCPGASRIGTVTVGAGPGAEPFFLMGSISLTEGYKGAPYGLAIAVRAVAGPIDLGTVVVRQAVFVDPIDAQLTAISDPLPTSLEGIPIRLRTVQVDVDRPQFIKAPTACNAKRVNASVHSQQGSTAQVSSHFAVAGCKALSLSPKTSMRLVGRRQTKVGQHPGLDVTLTQPTGQANLSGITAKLPLTLALDPDNANGLCEYEDGLKAKCPESSIIGKAEAVSPLLNKPLVGPVYFVKGVRFGKNGRRIRTLPTLLIPFRGEIAIDVRATSSVKSKRLVTTFAGLPDAQLSRVKLSLKGGRGGILTVSNRSICSGKQSTQLEIDGQNGKRFDRLVAMEASCARSK